VNIGRPARKKCFLTFFKEGRERRPSASYWGGEGGEALLKEGRGDFPSFKGRRGLYGSRKRNYGIQKEKKTRQKKKRGDAVRLPAGEKGIGVLEQGPKKMIFFLSKMGEGGKRRGRRFFATWRVRPSHSFQFLTGK